MTTTTQQQQIVHDVIIIGSGPAGYCAALYCARGNLNTVLFEGQQPGGQLITTTDVENYLGYEAINGFELTTKFREHAQKYGAKIVTSTIVAAQLQQQPFSVQTDTAETHFAKSIIVATGASAKRLFVQNEDTYWQKGISACATCDGALPMFRKQHLVVVGGGDTAMEEALFLSRFANQVTIVHRSDKFRASQIMLQRAKQNPKIQFLTNSSVVRADGDGNRLQSLQIENVQTKEQTSVPAKGLFYAIGHQPNTDLFKNVLTLDEYGYIKTQHHGSVKTNIDGVFAAGDVMDKHYRQAITAAGYGCMAAKSVEEYLQAKM